jgi:hypothetical protein
MSMDFEEFASLYETCERLDARKTLHTAWMTMGAAQGTPKALKEYLKPHMDILERSEQTRMIWLHSNVPLVVAFSGALGGLICQ